MSSRTKRRRLSPEQRRAELLTAAREVLGQGTLESLTVPSVTRQAGTAQGTFYRYFRDTEDVFVALIDERVVPRLLDITRTLDLVEPQTGQEVEKALQQWFLGLAELMCDEGPVLHAILTIPPNRPGPAAQRSREIMEQLRAWAESMIESVNGRVPYRMVNPRSVSYIVLGMTVASVRQATEEMFEPETWAREMAAFETWGLVQRGPAESA